MVIVKCIFYNQPYRKGFIMNKIFLLAVFASVSGAFVVAPAFAEHMDTYQSLSSKASADYTAASTQCDASQANAKTVCMLEAKAARAHAQADAASMYQPKDAVKTHKAAVNADYDLAKAKCADSSDKDSCISDAKAAKSHDMADSKGMPAATSSSSCDKLDATAKAACMARNTASSAKKVIADSVITAKIKADLVKDPDLKALDVHVTTVKGVVMLSGVVPSPMAMNKAETLARSVDGVTDVKSSLMVK